jgi:hypothetical protein
MLRASSLHGSLSLHLFVLFIFNSFANTVSLLVLAIQKAPNPLSRHYPSSTQRLLSPRWPFPNTFQLITLLDHFTLI